LKGFVDENFEWNFDTFIRANQEQNYKPSGRNKTCGLSGAML
jgi:hypothetical protein